MRSLQILGVRIADQTRAQAVDDLLALLGATGPRTVFFANAHTLNHAAADPAYLAVLNGATRVFGDGTGVRWAARAQGFRLRDNLNGTDLVPAFLTRAPGARCFLVGSTPERLPAIVRGARARFPDVALVGARHGFAGEEASVALCEEIGRAGADLVLVGMGNPLQEFWAARHAPSIPGALVVAVGGLMDFWHGSRRRAPAFFRRTGTEWVHVMAHQPHKAGRYLLGNPAFLARVGLHLACDRAATRRMG